MPKNVNVVCNTFLTDTHDLFIICENKEEYFAIYQINLDDLNPKLKTVLTYKFSEVDSNQVQGFHVRGSSAKERINLNKVMMCYILHGSDMFVYHKSLKTVTLIDKRASNMYYLSDDVIFYKTTEMINFHGHEVEHSKIYMIESQFSSYDKTMVYKDRDPQAEILNFGVDNTQKRLLILTGKKNMKHKRDKFITIFDIKLEKIMYSMQIHNKEVIGRLKSNLYNFVEGHIYYGNKVIKLRYDLIEKMQCSDIKECQLFDHYSEILGLKNGEFVQCGTPLQTCLYNKLAFIVRNKQQLRPRRLLVLPYLHERRIYLNRRHETNQFYTIQSYKGKDYIVCFCFTDSKIYVYTETGILIKRVLYLKLTELCGKPVTISENGTYFIFR